MTWPEFDGAVLAGGRSARMGTDKARLVVDGETLLARQLLRLREAGAQERLVVGRPAEECVCDPGVRFVPDRRPGAGPLAGLEAALAAGETGLMLVLAVDLPFLTADLLRRLVQQGGPEVGVVPVRAEQLEPLVALYPRRALAEITRRLQAGELALQPLVRTGVAAGWLKPWTISAADEVQFTNWNRPEDLAPR
jgi:molybdopterin-guanine dinucleotide biosynthesis protein A